MCVAVLKSWVERSGGTTPLHCLLAISTGANDRTVTDDVHVNTDTHTLTHTLTHAHIHTHKNSTSTPEVLHYSAW